ncbi:hypothetical protein TNCV_78351 [Trichonephila clavipes]|nr:hypothetical protein TNCV_78351 [Trichonephila clavipes]
MTLAVVLLDLGSSTVEGMDVFKCIVPLQHGGTLNSHRITSPLVSLVEGEEKWVVSVLPQNVLPQNWGGTNPNHTVI